MVDLADRDIPPVVTSGTRQKQQEMRDQRDIAIRDKEDQFLRRFIAKHHEAKVESKFRGNPGFRITVDEQALRDLIRDNEVTSVVDQISVFPM